jgi:hypothetical protein
MARQGQYQVGWDTSNLALLGEGCELLFVPQRQAGVLDPGPWRTRLAWLRQRFGTALWLAVEQRQQPDDDLWLASCGRCGRTAACRWWLQAAC